MAQAKVPEVATELVARLRALFPRFNLQAIDKPEWWEKPTFHSVMADFLSFFSREASMASEQQLRELSRALVDWSTHRGPLENAIDTCFLEHLRQVGAEKHLRRHLAEAQRESQRHA